MAVFSYTSRQKLIGSATIANYANVQISAYANIEIESLTDFYSDGIDFIDINSTSLEEVSYSHNESSARYVLSEGEYNYGSITNIESLLSDYGSIVDPIYTSRQVDDYGSITLSETIVPYGSLFEVESFGDLKLSRISIGDVTLTVLGTASIFVTPREFGRGGVGIKGDAYVTFNLRYFGSGNLFAFDSSAESSVYNDTEEIALFKFTGSAVEKNTESYVGSGSLYTFISSTETSISNPPEETILFKFSGYSVERFIASHAGSGKFTNDIQIDQKVTYSYNESSRIDIFVSDYGLISESTIDYEDDYGPLTDLDYLGRETADYGYIVPNRTILPYGSINIDSSADYNRRTIETGSGVISISGEGVGYTTPTEIGRGTISISGTSGDPIISLSHYGSGSLFTFISGTESTLKPASVDGVLYQFHGEAIERFGKGNYDGSGSLFTFDSSTESTLVSPDSYALFDISGDAYVTASLNYVGSGSLFTFISGTESTVSNPPEDIVRIKITGTCEEAYVPGGYQASGTLFTIVSGTETVSYVPKSTNIFTISGSASESVSPAAYVGSGLFNTKLLQIVPAIISDYADEHIIDFADDEISDLISIIPILNAVSAKVSVSYNPPEEGTLFRLSDEGIERSAYSYSGSVEFKLGGDSAYTIFELGHIGSGEFDINGSAAESVSPAPHIGSGSLFTFVSATEATVANPPEDTALFRFTGSAVEKNTESYFGDVNIDIEGSVNPIFRLRHIGSGSLFAFIGTTESYTASPDDTRVLFNIEGSAIEKNTESYVGSGSLYTFVSATESSVVSPDDTKVLFTFSGSAVEKNTESYFGSGSLFTFISKTESISVSPDDTKVLFTISGSAIEKNTESYVGSGSLYTFIGTTESYTVSPDDTRVLFEFSGDSTNRILSNNIGSGSLFAFSSTTESIAVNPPEDTALFRFTGVAVEKQTDVHRGSGSLFAFTGGTESYTASPDDTKVLFSISGEGSGRYLINNIGSGSLFAFSSTTESIAVNPPEDTALFKFVGNAVEKQTDVHRGSGSLFAFVGSTESYTVSPDDTKVLFEFVGHADESIVPAPHIGSGSLFNFINGTESITVFAPTEPVIFRFVGNGVESQATSYTGSGRLFAISGSTDSITLAYGIARVLFNIVGRGLESYTWANYDGEMKAQFFGQSTDRKVQFVRSKPTRIIII